LFFLDCREAPDILIYGAPIKTGKE
jgi:hypothetical protein